MFILFCNNLISLGKVSLLRECCVKSEQKNEINLHVMFTYSNILAGLSLNFTKRDSIVPIIFIPVFHQLSFELQNSFIFMVDANYK